MYTIAISKNYLVYKDSIMPPNATKKQVMQITYKLHKSICSDYGISWLRVKIVVCDTEKRLEYMQKHIEAVGRLLTTM